MSEDVDAKRIRHARMPITSMVLISTGPSSWIENISATGVLVVRPDDWRMTAGHSCALDLLIGEDLHIHLEAHVARVTAQYIAFEYTRIPEDKEVALWSLLGRFADDIDEPGFGP
ncbi:MAG: PilZ domain-containing protein [Dokdonella sp.]